MESVVEGLGVRVGLGLTCGTYTGELLLARG